MLNVHVVCVCVRLYVLYVVRLFTLCSEKAKDPFEGLVETHTRKLFGYILKGAYVC